MQYYISKIPNKDGYYEIHHKHCFKNHMLMHQNYLGEFDNCEEALEKAKLFFNNVTFCKVCLPNCNKQKEQIQEKNKELFEDHILNTKK